MSWAKSGPCSSPPKCGHQNRYVTLSGTQRTRTTIIALCSISKYIQSFICNIFPLVEDLVSANLEELAQKCSVSYKVCRWGIQILIGVLGSECNYLICSDRAMVFVSAQIFHQIFEVERLTTKNVTKL